MICHHLQQLQFLALAFSGDFLKVSDSERDSPSKVQCENSKDDAEEVIWLDLLVSLHMKGQESSYTTRVSTVSTYVQYDDMKKYQMIYLMTRTKKTSSTDLINRKYGPSSISKEKSVDHCLVMNILSMMFHR